MRRDFDFALLIGVLLGLVLACLLIFLPLIDTKFVHRWQELIAGLVALVAAAVAAWAVRQQILHAQEMENERRERREYAARKMLPHTLNSLSRYAESCLSSLRDVPKEDRVALDIGTMTLAPISDLDIEPIKQLLEFGKRDIQDRLSELLLRLQIQQSHLKPRIRDADPQEWFFSVIADAIEIHARANSLYDYVQGRPVSPPGLADFRNSAGLLGWTEEEFESLHRSSGKHWD